MINSNYCYSIVNQLNCYFKSLYTKNYRNNFNINYAKQPFLFSSGHSCICMVIC